MVVDSYNDTFPNTHAFYLFIYEEVFPYAFFYAPPTPENSGRVMGFNV